jgi:DNA-binding NarL/FixJ family response regulator
MSQRTVPIRVVALDDAKWDLRGIQEDLADTPGIQVVGATADALHFIELIEAEQPDVAITDLHIDGDFTAGLHVLAEIRSRFPTVRCLVLTAYPALERFIEALDLGAHAFVSKLSIHEGRYTLSEIVQIILRDGAIYDGDLVLEMRRRLALSPNPLTGPDIRHGIDITERQKEVLRLLVEERSNADIARILVVSENTVKTHVTDILQILDATDRHHAARIARVNNLV